MSEQKAAGAFSGMFDDLGGNAAAKPATAPKKDLADAAPRGRGRPSTRSAEEVATTVRLPKSAHKQIRALGVRIEKPVNTMFLEAMQEYCAKHAVNLKL